jgi:hypothetical protein
MHPIMMPPTQSLPMLCCIKEFAHSSEFVVNLSRFSLAPFEAAIFMFRILPECTFEPGVLLEPACSCMGDGFDSGSWFVRIQGFVHFTFCWRRMAARSSGLKSLAHFACALSMCLQVLASPSPSTRIRKWQQSHQCSMTSTR